jgi:hypothetical protein
MLVEIRSDVFRTAVIAFRSGLNVVLGDENATNSIGKSTLLMIVDFGFGGRGLLDHNTDLVTELGHHDYFFSFRFDGDVYRYRRGTLEPDVVYRCDDAFEPVSALGLEEYTAFLKHAYGIDLPELSFRALVGLYTRVWGKDNLSVERPLHVVQNQSGKDCVDTLLKTFGRYAPIRELSTRVAEVEAETKALMTAKRHSIVPAVGKKDYQENQRRIVELEGELAAIKDNLAQYATSLSEVVNKQVLDLKVEKDRLSELRLSLAARLERTQSNIAANRHIKSASFEGLLRYFPAINEARLTQVEEFHNGVARLLRDELRDSERRLKEQIQQIDESRDAINAQMTSALASVNEPTVLVDHIFRVAVSLQDAREENEQFETERTLTDNLRDLRRELAEVKQSVLADVENVINVGMRTIVSSVFNDGRKSPRLTLKEHSYSFEVYDDTGTGTAYASLIVLDLTIFLATELPLLAHDSVLFKNIENDSVARLLSIYRQTSKQSFIAIDEIEKYGAAAAALLRERSAIQLGNENVLYIKDWRA